MDFTVFQQPRLDVGSQYSVDPDRPELLCALAAISHWRSVAALVTFAQERHGYGDSDGGFGVTYPSDLDEYDRVTQGMSIPDGYVEVYSFWGPPDGYRYHIPEAVYLELLHQVVLLDGTAALVDHMTTILGTTRGPGD